MYDHQISLDLRRTREQLRVMFAMQASLNALVMPDWIDRDLAWHRAIYVEAAEYLEHLGTWKWWKKGTPDFKQANMELVDIWHFALSYYLRDLSSPTDDFLERAIVQIADIICLDRPEIALDRVTAEEHHQQVDRLVAAAGAGRFDTKVFVTLLAYSGLSFDTLYQRYVGKNVLNRFRQEHGYKTATYEKCWDGREDNEHLEELLQDLPADRTLPDQVHARLSQRYQSLVLNRV